MASPPPLPLENPPTPEGATAETAEAESSTTAEEKKEGEKEGESTTTEGGEASTRADGSTAGGLHKGKGGWAAVWSAEANAYYFWNEATQEVTWENPLANESGEASTSSSAPLPPDAGPTAETYGGIDPDLAYLDPSLSRSAASVSGSAAPAFQARFNARTGRFQGDPSMNPDRISEFKRGERQQGAYYDVEGWNESLAGRGIRGTEEEERGGKKRKVTAKEVEKFKAKKLEKKEKALSWLKD